MEPEIFPFKLGDFHCIALNDGWFSNDPLRTVLPGAPQDQLLPAFREHGLPDDPTTAPAICMLVDTGEHRILVDTGGGQRHPPYGQILAGTGPVQAALGQLMPALALAGIPPDTIDMIIFTHTDPEHVSGNVDGLGNHLFPSARYFLARQAWADFRATEVPLDPNEWDGWAGPMRFAQQQCAAIQDRIVLVDPDVEIAPGVRLLHAPSDSPHHVCVEFASGDQRLICLGDAMHTVVEVAHPDWGGGVEAAPQTRRVLLDRAGTTALLHGFHFPFPGLGHLVPSPSGWRWQSAL